MKRKHILIVIALLVGAAALVTAFGIANSLNPSQAEASAIVPGMKRATIVESLGALYDACDIGQYPDCDDIANRMTAGAKVSVLYKWRLSDTPRTFWVGFDEDGISVETLFDP